MDDPEPRDRQNSRPRLLIGGLLALLLAVVAVVIVAEPFASKPAGAAVLELSFQECVKDPSSAADCGQTTNGLEGAKGVAVSPDGTSVYVASPWEAALVLFARNPTTGALTPQGCIGDTIIEYAQCPQQTYGLAGASSVAVSPDGLSVYVAGSIENTIVRFDRNTSTGALTAVECVQDEDEFVTECAHTAEGMSQVEAVAVTPDGKSVYAGSNEDDSVVEFSRATEGDVGALSHEAEACIEDEPLEGGDECKQSTYGLNGITSLAVSPDNKSVYATSEFDNAVVRFDRNTATGALTPQGCIDDSSNGQDPCAATSTGLDEAWAAAVSPDGKSLYAVGRESDAIVRFDRNTATGALTPQGCIDTYRAKCAQSTSGLWGPQGVVASPDGSQVFVSTILGTVVGFGRDTAGALSFAGCVTDKDENISGCESTADGLEGGDGIAIAPNGTSLYAVSQFDEAIVHFNRVVAGVLSGQVLDSHANPVAGAPVEVCRSGGACVTRFSDNSGNYRAGGLEDGSYRVTARPPPGLEAEPGAAGPVAVSAGSTTTLNVMLGGELSPLPDNTTITSYRENEAGIPVVYWDAPVTVTTHACAGASSAKFRIVIGGATVRTANMTEQPSGTYSGQAQPLFPEHGTAVVKVEITCPSGPPVAFDFGIYIDPSGVVRNAATGAPIGGATVTLLRSESAAGPFDQVPDGSAVMSPGNRSNPDTTASDGSFGWDVVAGYYKVRAGAAGCSDAETQVLTIPPPVTDLVLELNCPSEQPTTPTEPTPPPPSPPPSNSFNFAKVQLNTRKGTAILFVKVPGPGKLVLSGKQVAKVSKAAKAPGKVKLPVKPKGSAKQTLAKKGTATVKVKVSYTPNGGNARTKKKSIKLFMSG